MIKIFGKKSINILVITIVVLSILTGCSSRNIGISNNKGNNNSNNNNSNNITIAVTSFADTLEPTEQYFSWVVSRYGVGETLIRFDENGELEPCLAESWEVSEDKLTWSFKIRENVKFSNGDDMTAEIVKASLERTFDLSNRSTSFFEPESIKTEGQTLSITTKEPVANLDGSLADPLFLIVDTNADTNLFAMEGPICTGPYAVESFSPTEYCDVVKNEYYWGGEVPLDKVTFKCVDDQTTRSMALQTGEVEIAYNLKTENLIDFKNKEDFEIQELDSLRTTYSYMNQNGLGVSIK